MRMLKTSLLCLCLLNLFVCLTSCADDDARQQIADTNAKLSQLQDSITTINTKIDNQKTLEVSNKLDSLQAQINQINGTLDTLGHNQAAYKATQDQLQQSLEQQIQSLQTAAANLNSSESSESSNNNNGIIEGNASSPVASSHRGKHRLKLALNKIKQRDFTGAIVILQQLIASPQTSAQVVADATYYLAISYAASGQYKSAIVTGRKFVTSNPHSANAPDALRVVYIAQMQLGMKKSAAKTAALIRNNYPNSDAAKKVK